MKPNRMFPRFVFISLLVLAPLAGWSDVRLPNLFTDHMVLQQKESIRIWGWADPEEQVTVAFRKQKVAVQAARDGRWMARLKSEKAGGPDDLMVTGRNVVTINDVLVGEVWIASGQSNMEWPLRLSFESAGDIAASANPMIRLFTVRKLKLDQPTNDVDGAWVHCNPETVPTFSAVAYYFARNLQKALGVPVGIIHTSWGGSPAEAWMSEAALAANPELKRQILDAYTPNHRLYLLALKKWREDKAAAEKEGRSFTKRAPADIWKPTRLFNAMIAPLIPYTIKGVIWYQGESNATRAYQYRALFQDLIRSWREAWDQGDFAFLAVQLAPWDKNRKRSLEEITAKPGDSDWAELREAQVLASQELKNVGAIVTTDLGEKDDIHPARKEPVGARLALAARGIAYKQRIIWSGPTFRKMKVRDNIATILFDHLGSGLEARGGPLTGFAICGENHRWKWARAKIDGYTVVVSHPEVARPLAVRYGWADYPVVNLYNREGLPASPFRTDDFPCITMSIKP